MSCKKKERIQKATAEIYKTIKKYELSVESTVCILEGVKLDFFLNTPKLLIIDGRIGELSVLNKKKKKIQRRN